ncbi:GTPase Era [Ornithobacterium rhinotracheale]|uniref:GTPase Era n=2 Tax=Ornithobacterium rhinotracheale TaxID=28251 RepID=I3ZYD9_ORNRL|nr:GTPase Era [Ornithobacterium rhinotracheale]AFL96723.1 GTP-binding protein Era [Ornithobacterium rhinotracheale DSM 15997]AIP99493.1 GTPase Era [Ornithobacterium rhinotracheale ORT-UMN 88]KGB66508.1 GTPase Era [Ornithobacterium rhinotracheale H06-030791]MBN3662499.1 GTPase Era [Ornithobacterium rhinotracheale]MCK0194072.1 GTPase Era [Ornithobacterium rhinotracheale]
MQKNFKSGFVNIVGNPNVGKSTLMNQLVGERLSIITNKVQTTRHRIMGIVTTPEMQIVFSDTPGVLQPAYELQSRMMNFVEEAFKDADIILYVVEPNEKELLNEEFNEKLKKLNIPVIILINKIDESTQEAMESAVNFWHEQLPKAEILPISALEGFNTDLLLDKIKALLPYGPQYYPEDQLTDKSERFIVNEVIREKILENYQKEIPYAVEVVTERFKEDLHMIRIDADIYVERDSQKGILIGHQGSSLSKVGKEARLALEKFFQKKVYLQLYVKVRKNWRKKDSDLERFGYKK